MKFYRRYSDHHPDVLFAVGTTTTIYYPETGRFTFSPVPDCPVATAFHVPHTHFSGSSSRDYFSAAGLRGRFYAFLDTIHLSRLAARLERLRGPQSFSWVPRWSKIDSGDQDLLDAYDAQSQDSGGHHAPPAERHSGPYSLSDL